MDHAALRRDFAASRAQGRRHKDAAEACGVSEGEAIAAHAGEHDGPLQAVSLRPDWPALLQSLEACGPLLALTRNRHTVHEKTGVYENICASGHAALALGEDIDLRLFLGQWHAGFAVTERARNPDQPPALSFQFFDRHGTAVHKIYLREQSDRAAFVEVTRAFLEPALTHVFQLAAAAPATRPDASFDATALHNDWSAMTDTHQFFGLLRKHGVERQQSFRLVQGSFARRGDRSAVAGLLTEAAFEGVPIMVFVGSLGCIQIHTGPVRRIETLEMGGARWLNVLDPGFNLHMNEDRMAAAWIVEKPTSDGVVTSVEAFDEEGGLMAMFFGARKPGQAERDDWRALVARLPRLHDAGSRKDAP